MTQDTAKGGDSATLSPNTSKQCGTGSLTITVPGCVQIGSPNQPIGPAPGAVPAGSGVPFFGNTVPDGWLLCNGAEVSREDYQGLFAAIGTTYGVGNGNTTFQLPDLRGRFPLGLDNMGGTSADRVAAAEADVLGGNSGADEVTLTKAQMPTHSHELWSDTNSHSLGALGDYFPRLRDNISSRSGTGWRMPENVSPLIEQGSSQAHNNMPPYLSLNYIIKT